MQLAALFPGLLGGREDETDYEPGNEANVIGSATALVFSLNFNTQCWKVVVVTSKERWVHCIIPPALFLPPHRQRGGTPSTSLGTGRYWMC